MPNDDTMPHAGHKQHLCYLRIQGVLAEKPEEYKKLIQHAKYFCADCGRAAFKAENLCTPQRLFESNFIPGSSQG